MERKLAVKVNAPELLDKALRKRADKGEYGIIVLASATEPYLQSEQKTRLTRRLLEIIRKYRFPVHIITRSNLVLRDLDLLASIDQKAILPKDLAGLKRGAIITFSFSTIDAAVSGIFEPGATPPEQRLKALSNIAADFLTGVSMMPLPPWISDTSDSLEAMFSAFAEKGAQYCMPADMTLFGNRPADSKTLVLRAISRHYPDLLDKYQQYYANSTNLPAYYRKAFYKKVAELGEQYSLRSRIQI